MSDRFQPISMEQLTAWVKEGKLRGAEEVVKGIDATGPAFCDMFRGRNRGKLVVDLREELGVG